MMISTAAAVVLATVAFDGKPAFECSWTQIPTGQDCLAVVGDAADEVALLERHGAQRADIVVSTPRHGVIHRSVERRDNGTWLMRGRSAAAPKGWGFVCAGEPLRCAMWEGATKRTIARATRKVTR
jgi:hypothetical protein